MNVLDVDLSYRPPDQGNSHSTTDVNSQIKMCFWPVKADVSLTGCPISMLSASCISANYPLLFTSLWSTLSPAIICLLPRDFVPRSFSCWSVFFFPVSKHISQCLAWSSHFSQSPSSVKPVYLADKHFGTYLLFLLTLTFSFFGIQMSTGKIKWKEAWKVNSPISAPTIGNVLAGVKLSGAHQTSYGLWQPLNENISVTMQTKLDCFSVMCHWWRAEKASSSSLHKSPLNMEGQCQRM